MVMLGFATALTDLMLIDNFTHLWIWCWVLQKKNLALRDSKYETIFHTLNPKSKGVHSSYLSVNFCGLLYVQWDIGGVF